ncbi:MAG: hypothetical protein FE037_05305 [Thermoplasmata archaeon]|nr:MAG: hypothetical protein FE037_05305 [Thermoplasmata archaeon]
MSNNIKPTQYIISLNNLYRKYSKYLPEEDYDYIDRLIDHLSSKNELTPSEAEEIESRCKKEWKKFILLFLKEFEKGSKKYEDILKREISTLGKIKTKVEFNDILLGEYDNVWDEIEEIYLQAVSKINIEKRNYRRNLFQLVVSFIFGVLSCILAFLLGGWL